MKFFRYWAKAGRDDLAAWCWSDESTAAAERAAREALSRIAEKVGRGGFAALGRYGYGERPLREPVLEALPGAALTRNSYGCEVLNTERAMFVDIDLAEEAPPGLLGRLLGRKAADRQGEALAKVESWLALNPDWGFRAYRARLTPKPWPFATPAAEIAFGKWQEQYASRQRGYATCRFLRAMGSPGVAAEVRPLMELHDARTRASSQLPLA